MGARSIVIVLAAVLFVPAAGADHVERIETVETEDVDEVETHYVVVNAHPAPQEDVGAFIQDFVCPLVNPACLPGFYGTQANAEIWEETNPCEGLQRQSVDCIGDEELEPADTHHGTLGCVSSNTFCGSPVWVTP